MELIAVTLRIRKRSPGKLGPLFKANELSEQDSRLGWSCPQPACSVPALRPTHAAFFLARGVGSWKQSGSPGSGRSDLAMSTFLVCLCFLSSEWNEEASLVCLQESWRSRTKFFGTVTGFVTVRDYRSSPSHVCHNIKGHVLRKAGQKEVRKTVLLAYGKGWSTIAHISYVCPCYRGGLRDEFMEGCGFLYLIYIYVQELEGGLIYFTWILLVACSFLSLQYSRNEVVWLDHYVSLCHREAAAPIWLRVFALGTLLQCYEEAPVMGWGHKLIQATSVTRP